MMNTFQDRSKRTFVEYEAISSEERDVFITTIGIHWQQCSNTYFIYYPGQDAEDDREYDSYELALKYLLIKLES